MNSIRRNTKSKVCISAVLAALMCLLLSLLMIAPTFSYAYDLRPQDLQYDFKSEQDGSGVSDPTTKIDISKLDSRSHAPVEGAVLAIYDTKGNELVRWTSDGTTKQFARYLKDGTPLNVEQEYILREISAPEHYDPAPDTRFVIGKFGTVTILEGPAAETTSKYALNLYDVMQPQYVDEYLENFQGNKIYGGKDGKSFWESLPITGDQAVMLLVAVGVAAVALIILVVARRKSRKASQDLE